MSQLEEFESTLKEVVQAKRLSASKMTKLTELAMKLMKDDVHLVSTLYRTHKSLSAQAKVSSLYVFDALARAAKHQANKQNLVGDIDSSEGNCATFLLKIEVILDGLFQDMVLAGKPEVKEKTKKILDIWVKGNTFPSGVLSRLADVLKSKDTVKEPTPKPAVPSTPSDPRVAQSSAATPTPPLPTNITPPLSSSPAAILSQIPALSTPQSTILALLTQAVNAGAAATSNQVSTPNPPALIPPAGPSLDVAQLALLQQLTQKAQIGSNMPYPNTGPASVQSKPTDVNVMRAPYADESSRYGDHTRYSSPDDDYRHDGRGGSRIHRGGRVGRWNEGRGKRDGRDQFRDRMAKHSRSKSPASRYGAREIKPYASPRRQSPMASVRESFNTNEPQPSAGDAEKDEFGRDIRALSPKSPKDPVDPPLGRVDGAQTHSSSPQPSSSSFSTTGAPSFSGPKKSEQENKVSPPGLEQFNVATFDFTSPAAWEALGKMWVNTYGAMPTTEQLMQFVMLAGTSVDPSQMSGETWDQTSGWDGSGNPYMNATSGMSMEGGGGFGYSDGGSKFQGPPSSNANEKSGGFSKPTAAATVETLAQRGAGGGQMRKVGDKWIFVRSGDSGVS